METETVVQFKIDALVNYQLCLKSIQDAIITINSKMIGIADYDSSKGTINVCVSSGLFDPVFIYWPTLL